MRQVEIGPMNMLLAPKAYYLAATEMSLFFSGEDQPLRIATPVTSRRYTNKSGAVFSGSDQEQ